MELPVEFIEKMKDLLKDDYKDFENALDKPEQKAITVNTSRMSLKDFEHSADFSFSPIPKIDNGYYVNNFRIGSHILNHAGVIYSQEPSAMYPVELLDIKENDIVLDICSAPGGKSIQILEKLNNTGLLVSNEIVYNRAKILFENLSKMGFSNYIITCNSPKDFEDKNLKFDKILVDAPCGGEGMFRKENFDFKAYKLINIETNAKRQLSILNSMKNLLKSGGRMVYSTCTYDIQENEQVILNFLKENPNFHLVEIKGYEDVLASGIKLENSNTNYTFRRYPHLHCGEGQFMAILEKDGVEEIEYDNFNCNGFSGVYRKEMQILNNAFKDVADISSLQFVKKDNTYFTISKNILDFSNLNVLTTGCVVGTYNKNIFKIHHNFYHVYGNLFYNKINLDDNNIYKYLHGEELDIEENSKSGIVAVYYKDISIGGGKVVNGKLKNYYEKDLRI